MTDADSESGVPGDAPSNETSPGKNGGEDAAGEESAPRDDPLSSVVAATEVPDEATLRRAVVALAEAADVDVTDRTDVEAVERVVSDVGATVETLDADIEELEDDLDTVNEAVEALEADLDEKVGDLRERVVQLYRELEAKPDADHDHPELAAAAADAETAAREAHARADTAAEQSESAIERLAELAERVDDLERRLDEDVDRKLSTVAGALVRAQRRLGKLENASARRETLTTIADAANRNGTEKATCGDCDRPVRIALLCTPSCPHCGADFGGFEPASGFFGTATLTIGDPPALEGDVAPKSGDDLFEDG
ncbi:hypothetical protein JCM17823_24880 [Halorubrum gandharaense]